MVFKSLILRTSNVIKYLFLEPQKFIPRGIPENVPLSVGECQFDCGDNDKPDHDRVYWTVSQTFLVLVRRQRFFKVVTVVKM